MFSKKISILIPCYNEINSIEKILYKIHEQKNLNKEIIVIDDCSVDGTAEILKKRELKNQFDNEKFIYHKSNQGKGSALISGLKQVTGEIVIIQDADLEYDPRDFYQLLTPFDEADADVVYGSRFIGGTGYVRLHFFWHFLANKILTFICNLLINLNMTDMETGYKLFRSDVIKSIKLYEKSFGIEPEITIKLAKKRFKFFEVPIRYNGRSYAEGKKIRLKDAFIAVYCIFKYSLLK
jgi:glycosyltransferase involved in cell wall biosynthesis